MKNKNIKKKTAVLTKKEDAAITLFAGVLAGFLTAYMLFKKNRETFERIGEFMLEKMKIKKPLKEMNIDELKELLSGLVSEEKYEEAGVVKKLIETNFNNSSQDSRS